MFYTHIAFGLLVSLLSLNFFDINNEILFILIVMFFSIFPDIDETRSRIGRKNKTISKITNSIFGHRGFIHSIYIPLILFILLNFINYEIALASLIGYLSHLFSDSLTIQGTRPLYPFFKVRINGPITTNSLFEKIIFLAIISANIYLLLIYI